MDPGSDPGFSTIELDEADREMEMKWAGIARASNGKLVCAPYDSDAVLVITPEADGRPATCSTFDCGVEGEAKWKGLVACPSNNKLYAAPEDASSVLVIDIDTRACTTVSIPPSIVGEMKFLGIAAGADGKLYGAVLPVSP